MRDALAEQALPEGDERVLWQYLVSAAFAMQNIPDEAASPALPMAEG